MLVQAAQPIRTTHDLSFSADMDSPQPCVLGGVAQDAASTVNGSERERANEASNEAVAPPRPGCADRCGVTQALCAIALLSSGTTGGTAIVARRILGTEWRKVCLAFLYFMIVNIMRMAVFTHLRRYFLRRSGLFTEKEVSDIDGPRLHLGSTWLTDMLADPRRERVARRVDITCRKGGHLWNLTFVYGLILPVLIGGKHTTAAALGGALLHSIIVLASCFALWQFRRDEHTGHWRAWSYLFGAADRIRDGRYAQLNYFVAGQSGSMGRLVFLIITHAALPPEDERPALWMLFTSLSFLPLTLGDALGEIVGTPCGRHSFPVYGIGEINKKSVEGCIAVFLGSLVPCLCATFLYNGADEGELSAWTKIGLPVCVAVATLVTETWSPRSTDNFAIPVCNALACTVWRATVGI